MADAKTPMEVTKTEGVTIPNPSLGKRPHEEVSQDAKSGSAADGGRGNWGGGGGRRGRGRGRGRDGGHRSKRQRKEEQDPVIMQRNQFRRELMELVKHVDVEGAMRSVPRSVPSSCTSIA
jgi:hypothetical protein